MRPAGNQIKRKILVVHLLVLALGIALSSLIYLRGQEVTAAATRFVEGELPLHDRIAELKVDILQQEPILYEYAATADRAAFRNRMATNRLRIDAGLAALQRAIPGSPQVAHLVQSRDLLAQLADDLDSALQSGTVDSGKTRLLLSFVHRVAADAGSDLDRLHADMHDRVAGGGALTRERMREIVRLVVAFSLVIFLIALFLGYYVHAYLSDAAERRRLAMFAERNPSPVLSVDESGAMVYVNPGARDALRRLGFDSRQGLALLPPDLPARLAGLGAREEDQATWEYPVGEAIYSCAIHHLRDLGLFHAYLLDVTQRRRAERDLAFQAHHDALTSLPNRRKFQEDLERMLGQEDNQGAVLLLGVDRFHLVLDALGHVVGDRFLLALAKRLEAALQACADVCPDAVLYRFEGERFAALVPAVVRCRTTASVAEAVAELMQKPIAVDGHEIYATFSIGISLFPQDGADSVSLLRNADSAMQQVRSRGGNGYQAYAMEMHGRALASLSLDAALRHALGHGELEVHYQPQVEIASGRTVGVEALLRWRHPERGWISPAQFMPLAEETGLVREIGEWVLRQACRQARQWRDAGRQVRMAVNLSARQFLDPHLPDLVRHALADARLEPAALELEVTESLAMHNIERTISTLREFRAIGVSLSIDDFGTGYSNLSYLQRLPIDRLKVDQSFVRNLTRDSSDAAIARTVVTLGHTLGLRVIAEGVETDDQLQMLKSFGCEEAQGYLFSRAQPAEAFGADMALTGAASPEGTRPAVRH